MSKIIKNLFWETYPTTLDMGKHKAYIIPRVMDYGSLDDVVQIMSYYGRDVVLEILKETSYLDKKTLSFCEVFFGISRTEFRAYKKSQLWKTWK